MDSFELLHASDSRNCVVLRLTMLESNLDEISYSRMAKISTFKSAFAAIAKTINQINGVINYIQGAVMFAAGVKNMMTQITGTYGEAYKEACRFINGVFNASSYDLASILPQNGKTSSVFKSALSPNDPFANIDLRELSKETVTAIVAKSLETVLDTLRQEANLLSKTLAVAEERALTIEPGMAFLLGRKPDGTLTDDKQTSIASNLVDKFNSSPGALAAIPDHQGALYFADQIKIIRDSVLAMQQAYDLGLQSNRTKLVRYTTPRLMSIREVAFELGVDFEKLNEIDALNPALESVNFIPKGTVVVVAI
jgi:hypothetical protein